MNKKNESFLDLWNLTGPSPVVSIDPSNPWTFHQALDPKVLEDCELMVEDAGPRDDMGRHGTTVWRGVMGLTCGYPCCPSGHHGLFSRCFNDFLGHLDARIGRPNSFDDWLAMFQNAKCLGWVQFTDLDEAPGGMVRKLPRSPPCNMVDFRGITWMSI